MEWSQIADLAPLRLARLLDIERETEWSEQDTTAALRQQLDAPLLPDLLMVRSADSNWLEALISKRPAGETFLEHLGSTTPAIEILLAIKALAHHIKEDVSNPLHGEPSGVIYFAAIAAALVRCQSRITSLTDRQLLEGFDWTRNHRAAGGLNTLMASASEWLKRSGRQNRHSEKQ